MQQEKILGPCAQHSPEGQARMETHAAAQSAKERGEITELYAAYEKAIEDRFEVEDALARVVGIYAGKDGKTSAGNDLHAVRAMRDVALAAIELAKNVAMTPNV